MNLLKDIGLGICYVVLGILIIPFSPFFGLYILGQEFVESHQRESAHKKLMEESKRGQSSKR